MEAAISTIINQFKHHAGSDGPTNTLSRDEFQKLVVEQLPSYIKNGSDTGVINLFYQSNDGEMTFAEFWQVIGDLASKQGGFSQ